MIVIILITHPRKQSRYSGDQQDCRDDRQNHDAVARHDQPTTSVHQHPRGTVYMITPFLSDVDVLM
jgi:hypothetical protein